MDTEAEAEGGDMEADGDAATEAEAEGEVATEAEVEDGEADTEALWMSLSLMVMKMGIAGFVNV